MPEKLLMPREDYLASGIHIGMKQRTADMKPYIYKIRSDGLAVLNLGMIDERIKTAAKFLSKKQNILVVGRKAVSQEPAKKLAESIGAKAVTGRFLPGTLTNPVFKRYFEADAIVISDPLIDYQALKEAVTARTAIVAICDTFNETRQIDLIIPANNKSRKSLGTLYYLLAREILKERGDLKSDSDFKFKLEDFVGVEEYSNY
jgi:small subunit ribosomal protein S2